MNAFAKRLLDFWAALLGLVILSPLLLAVAVAIRLTMGTPVLFRQTRPGYRSRPFKVVKYRTMTVGDTAVTHLSDAGRITPLGEWLRRFSLDELPQLWNVLVGEMSLVGPRPLLMEYLERYTPEQARRQLVKPGITGWAQVHGRQDIPFSQRIAYDIWYVNHQGFWLDIRILLLTLLKIAGGSGVKSGQDIREVDDLGLHPAVHKREENQ